MSEKLNNSEEKALSPEEQYHSEQEALFLEDYPAIEYPQLSPEECAERIQELETLYTNFEQTYDLEMLHTIQAHTYEEAIAHEVRQAAKKDLLPIFALRNLLAAQVQLSEDTKEKLFIRYKLIQAAIGGLRNGELYHSIR